ncbi:fimbria/pilus periplasmic chaperone [Enterobacteriaceae bacterium C23F]
MCRLKLAAIFLSTLMLGVSFNIMASVVMNGSRIIYQSDEKSVDVQLKNNDAFPYIVQAWFDSGDENSTPSNGKAPFIVTPPTFKIASSDGQLLRIFYTGEKPLPQDRESVFYFNFLQIPPGNVSGDKGNQMVVLLKNRLKLFYRPAGLNYNKKKIFDYLTFSNLTAKSISITNKSPVYISLNKVNVKGVSSISKPPMIPPFSSVDVALNANHISDRTVKGIQIGLINDYGAMIKNEYPVEK